MNKQGIHVLGRSCFQYFLRWHSRFLVDMFDEGFTLMETLISLAIASLFFTLAIASYLMFLHVSEQIQEKTFQLDDSWVYYHALEDDLHSANSYFYQAQTIEIKQGTQMYLIYRLSPLHLIYRSVNDYGAAVVSTDVSAVQYHVEPRIGVDVDVYYGQGNSIYDSKFAFSFALGHSV
ncbi:PulJ/GspJ family protein [Sulfoacidibacillus thermotolerans]|uniref:Prepilin-type N-terminal cleavage/methylation domain-containing protein n=1 Tax=Sulfoacidibacillus thermotolerans TaxID=1765684 RepID=A0A2U3DC10_SULT2|nr:type II secretion system protein [Sulfoacidibacillus thermotolerans]PWI58808.1 hypothetical protein BM613_01575 [Sulfoacidibacillus thermotolerans]